MSQVIEPESIDLEEPVPDSDILYEVVDGRIVEIAPMGAFEGVVASVLMAELLTAARTAGAGLAVAEVLFELRPGHRRRPDVAFVSEKTWPRSKSMQRGAAWCAIPDIPIEVVSPSNTFEGIETKTREYLDAGSVEVWVVSPIEQRIYIHRSPTQIDVLTVTDTLTSELIPGLSLPLEQLFATPVEYEPPEYDE